MSACSLSSFFGQTNYFPAGDTSGAIVQRFSFVSLPVSQVESNKQVQRYAECRCGGGGIE